MTAVGANKDFSNVSRERLAEMMNDGIVRLRELEQRAAKMETALKECRQYVRTTTGSWWNNREARELMTMHINPALGLDPWAGG